jgi:hypothetical protein
MSDFIMSRSAKLKELLVFLEGSCGFHNLCNGRLNGVNKIVRRKKVLILVSLPEFIFITSQFLNALGIPHETVIDVSKSYQGSHVEMPSFKNCRDRQQHFSLINENATHRFMRSPSDSYNPSSVDVLIGDPEFIGQYCPGIISYADYIISLDENWSGRGRNHADGIVMKNIRFYQGNPNNSSRFIKFVVENTYEQIFVAAQSVKDPRIISPQNQGMIVDSYTHSSI